MIEDTRILARRAGVRLRQHRIATKTLPAELAADLDIRRASYYRCERGEIVKLDTMVRIARAIGMTLKQLLAPISVQEALALHLLGLVGAVGTLAEEPELPLAAPPQEAA